MFLLLSFVLAVSAQTGWLSSIKCPPVIDPTYKFMGCKVVNDKLSCLKSAPAPFDTLSVDAEDKLQQRAVWAFRGRRGSGCCFVGADIFCGTNTNGWVWKNEAYDAAIAGISHVFKFVAKPIKCDEGTASYRETGCTSQLEGDVNCRTCFSRASCPARGLSPFDVLNQNEWNDVKLRANWAARGRWASGCCVESGSKKIRCESKAKPGLIAMMKNTAMDAIGDVNEAIGDAAAAGTAAASGLVRQGIQDLMYGDTDRQNVLSQYVDAKNFTSSGGPAPRTVVGKVALWIKLRIERDMHRLKSTDLAFKFGPTDPGWATAFTEFLAGVRKLVPNWIARSHEKTGRSYEYTMKNKETISVIGDWGTGNTQSVDLARLMVQDLKPNRFIHLGDIYYAGTREELQQYFVEPCLKAFKKRYPHELEGIVWNLPGNHDYYGGAMPFFDTLTAMRSNYGPYFSLTNDHWMIVGLDTALNDSDPIETAKAVKCTTLPKVHLAWAKKQIDDAKAKNKGVIFMSHHMLFSCHKGSTCGSTKTNDKSFTNENLYNQFGKSYIEQIDIWLWGHEHGYARYKPYRGLRHGYLIGNGGVPTYVSNNPYHVDSIPNMSPPVRMSAVPATFASKKGVTGLLEDFKLYCNGLVNLEFDGPLLKLSYHELREGKTYEDWKLERITAEDATFRAGKIVTKI